MIREIVIQPKPQNKLAPTTFFCLLGLCAVAFGASFAAEHYRGLIQLVAILLLVSALLVYTRYVAPHYSYEITTDSEDTPIFVVRSRTGRRMSTLCRVDLADIFSVTQEDREARRVCKTPAGVRRYVYTPTMMPPRRVLLDVRARGEHSHVFVECPPEFCDLLRVYSEEARHLRALRGDE